MRVILAWRVAIFAWLTLWMILPASAAAQPRREIHGRLFWVEDDGERQVAADVELVSQAGDSAVTDANGTFRLQLRPMFRSGETLGVSVDLGGWFIGAPADGQLRIPYASERAPVEIELYRAGSERFWSDERIEGFLLETADLALERLDSTLMRRGIDFDFYVRRWAHQHGWNETKARDRIEAWIARAKAGADPFRGGLAALVRGDLEEAVEHFRAAAKEAEKKLDEARRSGSPTEEELERLARRIARSHGLEGTARYLANAYHAAVAAYELALRHVSRQDSPQLWASLSSSLGTVILERAIHPANIGGPDIQELYAARQLFEAILKNLTRGSFPLAWATAQHGLGRSLAYVGKEVKGYDALPFLREAVHALNRAMEVRTHDHLPHFWASSQMEQLMPLVQLGLRAPRGQRRQMLESTLSLYRAVATIRSSEETPDLWAEVQINLARVLEQLGDWASGPAIKAQYFESAAEVCRRILARDVPHFGSEALLTTHEQHATSLFKRAEQAGRDDRAFWFARAADAWGQALPLVDHESAPTEWMKLATRHVAALISAAKTSMLAEERQQRLEDCEKIASAASRTATAAEIPHVALLSIWAETLWLQGRTTEAVRLLKDALAAYPHYYDGHLMLRSWAYHTLYDFELAYQTFAAWIEAHPEDLGSRVALTQNQFTTGRFAECVDESVALRRNPQITGDHLVFTLVFEIASRRSLSHSDKQIAELLRMLASTLEQLPAHLPHATHWLDQSLFVYLEKEASLKPHRPWLSKLFEIFRSEDRDAVVAALQELAESLELPQA